MLEPAPWAMKGLSMQHYCCVILHTQNVWTIEREFDGRLLLITRKTFSAEQSAQILLQYTLYMKVERPINRNFDEHIYVMQFPIIYLILLHPFSHHTTFYLWGKWGTRFDRNIHLANISVISLRLNSWHKTVVIVTNLGTQE